MPSSKKVANKPLRQSSTMTFVPQNVADQKSLEVEKQVTHLEQVRDCTEGARKFPT